MQRVASLCNRTGAIGLVSFRRDNLRTLHVAWLDRYAEIHLYNDWCYPLRYRAPMRHDADSTNDHQRKYGDRTLRLTVTEAAGVMGISGEAVRQRIKRGTLTTEKDSSGSVFVLLVDDQHRQDGDRPRKDADSTGDSTDLVASLEEQVAYLKETVAKRDEEIRRRDHLLAAALERIPAIEAPAEERESPVTAAESRGNGTGSEDREVPQERRSWWRHFFGLQ